MANLNLLEAAEDQIYSESLFGSEREQKIGEKNFKVGPNESMKELMKRKNYMTQVLSRMEQINFVAEKKARFRSKMLGYTISSVLFA